MTRYLMVVEVDEEQVKQCGIDNYNLSAGEIDDDDVLDIIRSESGWLEQSGVSCVDVVKKEYDLNKPYITIDRLFIINRLVKEVRKNTKSEKDRARLKDWDRLLNHLINAKGSTMIRYLKRISQDQEDLFNSQEVEDILLGGNKNVDGETLGDI